MNRVFLAAALASAGFTAILAIGPSVAQTAPGAPAPKADADGDGIVTRAEELARADARFDRMDTNKDGKISADELRRPGPGMAPPPGGADGAAPPPPGAGGGRMGERMIARLDTNGDGVIDRDEFRAQAMRRFDRMDTNKDGKIDPAERQAARDAMGAMRGRGPGGGVTPPPPPPSAPEDKPGQ